jgi:hypothetical protein
MRVSMRTTGVIAVIVTAFLLTAPGASAATRAWWHMNETSGSTMHDAVGSADGTNHNVAKKRAGVWGSMAYGFNGWNSYVSVPHRRALNPGWAKLTIKISVRFSSIPPQDYDLSERAALARRAVTTRSKSPDQGRRCACSADPRQRPS